MTNKTEIELKKALESVSDSYPDFVDGGLRIAKKRPEGASMLLSYIQNYPKATTSEIIQFETEHILFIKPL